MGEAYIIFQACLKSYRFYFELDDFRIGQ